MNNLKETTKKFYYWLVNLIHSISDNRSAGDLGKRIDWNNLTEVDLKQIKTMGDSRAFELMKGILNQFRDSKAVELTINASVSTGKNEAKALLENGRYFGYVDVLKIPETANKRLLEIERKRKQANKT